MSRVWNHRNILLDGIKTIKRKMKEIPTSNSIEDEYEAKSVRLNLTMEHIVSFNEYVEKSVEDMKEDYKKSMELIEDWREQVEVYLLEKIKEKEDREKLEDKINDVLY
jgi:cysteinyl-tRNA synthetase